MVLVGARSEQNLRGIASLSASERTVALALALVLVLVLVLASAEAVAGITLGGAVAVALVTAVTTNRRQREQLAHDRELFDLADLRKLLDEAAGLLNRAGAIRDEVQQRAGSIRSTGPAPAREQMGLEGNKKIDEASAPLLVMEARLRVRLGPSDSAALAFESATRSVRLLGVWIVGLAFEADTALPEIREELEGATEEFVAAYDAFLTAATNLAGTIRPRVSHWRPFQFSNGSLGLLVLGLARRECGLDGK